MAAADRPVEQARVAHEAAAGAEPALLARRVPIWRRVFSLAHVLTAAFIAGCAPLIFTHAMWIDEAQALVIARDSHSPAELFHNLRYEGHPPLWHILLWILTRFTTSIYAMQVLHLALAAGSVYLMARFAPFPRLAKILFPFGYFPLFEYGVISRNYQLVMLLAFAFCALWRCRPGAYLRLGVIVALMCLSHALGVIIAAGLGGMLLLEALGTACGREQIGRRPWLFVAGLVIAAGGATGSAMLLKPPADYGYARVSIPIPETAGGGAGRMIARYEDADWYWQWNYPRAQVAASALADGMLPIVKHQPHFWDTALVDTSPAATAEGILIAAVALICLGSAWRAWVFYLIAVLGLLSFNYLKFQGGTRHHGMLFVALMAAFWIAWTARGEGGGTPTPGARPGGPIPRRLLTLFLAVQVYSAGVAVYFAWQVPFATGRAAAEAIQSKLQPGDLVVADMEFLAPTISAYLPDHPIYVANTGLKRNFVVWLKGRPDSRPAGFAAARDYARQQHHAVIWITRMPGPYQSPGVVFVGQFDGGGNSLQDAKAIMGMETFAVYRIEP